MQVKYKQNNSRMCVICGMDNPFGLQAPFYVMEDDSVMTLFRYRQEHQSYPGRVHGGLITAMLDELGFRAYWAFEPEVLAVTMELQTKYRRPVPLRRASQGDGDHPVRLLQVRQKPCPDYRYGRPRAGRGRDEIHQAAQR